MGVLDEELAADEPARRLSPRVEGVELVASALLHHRHGRDAVAKGERGKKPLRAARIGCLEEDRRRDHRALDERAGQAGAPHFFHEGDHVEHGATATSEVLGNQESRPAERRHRLPHVWREAGRLEGEGLDALDRAMRLRQELLLGSRREVHVDLC